MKSTFYQKTPTWAFCLQSKDFIHLLEAKQWNRKCNQYFFHYQNWSTLSPCSRTIVSRAAKSWHVWRRASLAGFCDRGWWAAATVQQKEPDCRFRQPAHPPCWSQSTCVAKRVVLLLPLTLTKRYTCESKWERVNISPIDGYIRMRWISNILVYNLVSLI